MKRIQAACLNQTIHFKLKEDISHALAVSQVKDEYGKYKKMLERNHTKYKIMDEKMLTDGSIIVKVKKSINYHDVGNYLD